MQNISTQQSPCPVAIYFFLADLVQENTSFAKQFKI